MEVNGAHKLLFLCELSQNQDLVMIIKLRRLRLN